MIETLRPPRDEDLPTVVRLRDEHSPEPVERNAGRDDRSRRRGSDEGSAWIDVHGRPRPDWAEARASDKGTRLFGVRRAWRRCGLGRALLLHAFGEFASRGLRTAGLDVDAESLTGANRLYEEAGMHVSARFDIYEKALA